MTPDEDEVWQGFVRRMRRIEHLAEQPSGSGAVRWRTRSASAWTGAVGLIAALVVVGVLATRTIPPQPAAEGALGGANTPSPAMLHSPVADTESPPAAGSSALSAGPIGDADRAVSLARANSHAIVSPTVLSVDSGRFADLFRGRGGGVAPSPAADASTWRVVLRGQYSSSGCQTTCIGRETIWLDATTGSVTAYELVAPDPALMSPEPDTSCGPAECP